MLKNLLSLICAISFSAAIAQDGYDDYIGAGHSDGIIVTTSSDFQRSKWREIASGDKTITAQGLEGKLMEASRFLAQAAIGAEEETIRAVANLGIENWIDMQLSIAPSDYLAKTYEIFDEVNDILLTEGTDPEDLPTRPDWTTFRYAWWTLTMEGEDLLRQKVSKALSEILVVSESPNLRGFGDGLSSYYDIFSRNAFGNYKDILMEVTLHPSMGSYLSHLRNPKANIEENTHPDQNYAREVMQLFSIGLYELNNDGTRKTNSNGDWIPSYDNQDIIEFSDIYTGLGLGGLLDDSGELRFSSNMYNGDMTIPMIMYEEWHETGEKILLNGFVIPDGQNGMKDIEDAITNLFDHPNVGPFLSRRLIQHMVKSNPTSFYIDRVASVFNDDGAGVRGNMAAVIKAILMDEEARSCLWLEDPIQGKLREPIERHVHFIKGLDYESPSGKLWMNSWNFHHNTGQFPLASPSVFNFFLPGYKPVGALAQRNLSAPEFQIYNSNTSIGYANTVFDWTYYESIGGNWISRDYDVFSDLSDLVDKAQDPEVLLNHLDLYLMNGQLTNRTRGVIKGALQEITPTLNGLVERIYLATYLVMISPEYNILK